MFLHFRFGFIPHSFIKQSREAFIMSGNNTLITTAYKFLMVLPPLGGQDCLAL